MGSKQPVEAASTCHRQSDDLQHPSTCMRHGALRWRARARRPPLRGRHHRPGIRGLWQEHQFREKGAAILSISRAVTAVRACRKRRMRQTDRRKDAGKIEQVTESWGNVICPSHAPPRIFARVFSHVQTVSVSVSWSASVDLVPLEQISVNLHRRRDFIPAPS